MISVLWNNTVIIGQCGVLLATALLIIVSTDLLVTLVWMIFSSLLLSSFFIHSGFEFVGLLFLFIYISTFLTFYLFWLLTTRFKPVKQEKWNNQFINILTHFYLLTLFAILTGLLFYNDNFNSCLFEVIRSIEYRFYKADMDKARFLWYSDYNHTWFLWALWQVWRMCDFSLQISIEQVIYYKNDWIKEYPKDSYFRDFTQVWVLKPTTLFQPFRCQAGFRRYGDEISFEVPWICWRYSELHFSTLEFYAPTSWRTRYHQSPHLYKKEVKYSYANLFTETKLYTFDIIDQLPNLVFWVNFPETLWLGFALVIALIGTQLITQK